LYSPRVSQASQSRLRLLAHPVYASRAETIDLTTTHASLQLQPDDSSTSLLFAPGLQIIQFLFYFISTIPPPIWLRPNASTLSQLGRHSPNVSTILLRLFLLQFFPKPIRIHQILPTEDELWTNCGRTVEKLWAWTDGRRRGRNVEELWKNCRKICARVRERKLSTILPQFFYNSSQPKTKLFERNRSRSRPTSKTQSRALGSNNWHLTFSFKFRNFPLRVANRWQHKRFDARTTELTISVMLFCVFLCIFVLGNYYDWLICIHAYTCVSSYQRRMSIRFCKQSNTMIPSEVFDVLYFGHVTSSLYKLVWMF
jgi:hypothetical protein